MQIQLPLRLQLIGHKRPVASRLASRDASASSWPKSLHWWTRKAQPPRLIAGKRPQNCCRKASSWHLWPQTVTGTLQHKAHSTNQKIIRPIDRNIEPGHTVKRIEPTNKTFSPTAMNIEPGPKPILCRASFAGTLVSDPHCHLQQVLKERFRHQKVCISASTRMCKLRASLAMKSIIASHETNWLAAVHVFSQHFKQRRSAKTVFLASKSASPTACNHSDTLTHRQSSPPDTLTHTHTHMHTHTCTHTHAHTNTHTTYTARTNKEASKKASKRASNQTSRQAGKQASRQAGKQASRQASRQAGRQASKHAGRQAGQQASRQAQNQAGRKASKHAGRQAGQQASTKPGKQARKKHTRNPRNIHRHRDKQRDKGTKRQRDKGCMSERLKDTGMHSQREKRQEDKQKARHANKSTVHPRDDKHRTSQHMGVSQKGDPQRTTSPYSFALAQFVGHTTQMWVSSMSNSVSIT